MGAFSHNFSVAPSGKTTDRIKKVTGCKDGTNLHYHHAQYGEDRGSRAGCRRKSVIFCLFLFVCHALEWWSSKSPFIATQVNSTQLDVELSSVELSCVAIDTLTDATQLSSAIGNAADPVAAYSQSARSRVSRVELSCVAINGELKLFKRSFTETLWSGVIFKIIWCHCIEEGLVCSCAPIVNFFCGPPTFSHNGKFIPKIAIFRDFWGCRPTFLKPEWWNLVWGCWLTWNSLPKPNFIKIAFGKFIQKSYQFRRFWGL